jgi:hypothetical protein
MQYLSPGDGIGIRVGLRNQILGVRVSSGAPNFKRRAPVDKLVKSLSSKGSICSQFESEQGHQL